MKQNGQVCRTGKGLLLPPIHSPCQLIWETKIKIGAKKDDILFLEAFQIRHGNAFTFAGLTLYIPPCENHNS